MIKAESKKDGEMNEDRKETLEQFERKFVRLLFRESQSSFSNFTPNFSYGEGNLSRNFLINNSVFNWLV